MIDEGDVFLMMQEAALYVLNKRSTEEAMNVFLEVIISSLFHLLKLSGT